MADISDLIKAAVNEKPVDVSNAFNDLMQSRISDAIEAKRLELSGEEEIIEDEDIQPDTE